MVPEVQPFTSLFINSPQLFADTRNLLRADLGPPCDHGKYLCSMRLTFGAPSPSCCYFWLGRRFQRRTLKWQSSMHLRRLSRPLGRQENTWGLCKPGCLQPIATQVRITKALYCNWLALSHCGIYHLCCVQFF